MIAAPVRANDLIICNLAFYVSELHISDENLAFSEEIMTLPIEEAELLIEDLLDEN